MWCPLRRSWTMKSLHSLWLERLVRFARVCVCLSLCSFPFFFVSGVIDMSSVVEADLALAKQLTMEEISELENAEQRRRVMEASDLLYAQNLYEEEVQCRVI